MGRLSDGINMRLHGGTKLDRKLAKMQQSVGTKIVKDSLKSGASQVKKTIKANIPQSESGSKGWKTYKSRNHDSGTLRRSVRHSLLNKVNVDRTSFLAGVYIANKGGTGNLKSKGGEGTSKDDGWYAPFVMGGRHAPNAHGFSGGYDVIDKSVKEASKKFISTVGRKVATKISAQANRDLNR